MHLVDWCQLGLHYDAVNVYFLSRLPVLRPDEKSSEQPPQFCILACESILLITESNSSKSHPIPIPNCWRPATSIGTRGDRGTRASTSRVHQVQSLWLVPQRNSWCTESLRSFYSNDGYPISSAIHITRPGTDIVDQFFIFAYVRPQAASGFIPCHL